MLQFLIQANLNHARKSQDLFLHTLVECDCSLGIAAEPHRIPNHLSWAGDTLGSMAITWRWWRGAPLENEQHMAYCRSLEVHCDNWRISATFGQSRGL